MTVETSNVISGPFIGNGATTRFPRNFSISDASHVVVTFDGITQTGGYTVLDPDQTTADVEFNAAPDVGVKIYFTRNTPIRQDTDYSSQSSVSPEQIEKDVDYRTRVEQEVLRDYHRFLKMPFGSAGAEVIIGATNTTLIVDEDGNLSEGPSAENIQNANSILANVENVAWSIRGVGLTALMEWKSAYSGMLLRPQGAGTGQSLTIGVDNVPTTNTSPQINMYGKDHGTWGGECFITATTALMPSKPGGRAGMIHLGSYTEVRQGMFIGARTQLTPGGTWNANTVPNPDAPLHVFAATGTLGTNPQIPDIGANKTYNPVAVFEGNVSGGGQISCQYLVGTNGIYHDIHGSPVSSVRFVNTYDHHAGVVKLQSSGNVKIAYGNSDVFFGKTARNTGSDGAEFRDNGDVFLTATDRSILYLNRLGADGIIAQFAHANSVEGSISISGGTVSYNSFHASHLSQLKDRSQPTLLRGTVCETINEMSEWFGIEYQHPLTNETVREELAGEPFSPDQLGQKYAHEIRYTSVKEVEKTRVIESPVLSDEYEIETFKDIFIDGKMVRTQVTEMRRDPVMVETPLVGEDGSPILGADKKPIVFREPKMLEEEVIETIEEEVTETVEVVAEIVQLENKRLPKFKVSDTANSPRVYGVFGVWDDQNNSKDVDAQISAIGAGFIRVSVGIKLKGGELLTSAGDGTAMIQEDDIIRSSTIGKVSSTVVADEYEDGSYTIPCVLMCG